MTTGIPPEAALLLTLVEMTCVICVAAYMVTRTRWFDAVIAHKRPDWLGQLVLILFFGALSIYGTAGGVEILGAPVNVRDLGPMVAGLSCGPFIGIASGIIGGLYRLSLGGFTAVACSLATVLAGLLGGIVYYINHEKFVRVHYAVLFAAGMESIHMGLVLIISRPVDQALALVSQVAIPMILANALGMFIFATIIRNRVIEKETADERDRYQAEVQRRNAELRIAQEIQTSFLPQAIPPVPGYDLAARSIPALEVGGDFYDVIIPVGKHKIGIIIADVSGKGIPAALFMALSRTITRANAHWHTSAARAITDANQMIAEDAQYGMFVTLFFGILDPATRQFTYVNAGHNPPVILDERAGWHPLIPADPALGVLDSIEYTESSIQLQEGAIMVLYTDGVTEAEDPLHDQYGEHRLQKVIEENRAENAEGILRAILDDVRAFAGKAPQSDDITLVVMKVGREGVPVAAGAHAGGEG